MISLATIVFSTDSLLTSVPRQADSSRPCRCQSERLRERCDFRVREVERSRSDHGELIEGGVGPVDPDLPHRSTSPRTGSTDEMIATASATRRPRIMCGSVWML